MFLLFSLDLSLYLSLSFSLSLVQLNLYMKFIYFRIRDLKEDWTETLMNIFEENKVHTQNVVEKGRIKNQRPSPFIFHTFLSFHFSSIVKISEIVSGLLEGLRLSKWRVFLMIHYYSLLIKNEWIQLYYVTNFTISQ